MLLARPFLPRLSRKLALLGSALLGMALWPMAATAQLAPARGFSEGHLCRAAITEAERGANLPRGLLQAIGRVESGRRDPETGQFSKQPLHDQYSHGADAFRYIALMIKEPAKAKKRPVMVTAGNWMS
jgi:hypothetical protein